MSPKKTLDTETYLLTSPSLQVDLGCKLFQLHLSNLKIDQ